MDSYDDENDPEANRSVFGDDPGFGPGASVFGDEEPSIDDEIDDLRDSPTEYVEHDGASVFDAPGGTESVQQSVFGQADEPGEQPVSDAEDINVDPWPEERTAAPDTEFVSSDETVALDVEASEPDDLETWSVLGSSSPRWDENAPAETGGSWDPGPAPGETDVVEIGEPSERFFTYEDGGGGEGGFVDDGFTDGGGRGGSDIQTRVLTGVILLAVAVAALMIGPVLALVLIAMIVALSAGEFFNAIRVAGYQPATLLGLTASVALPLAVYWRGQQAVPLILALAVIFGMIWFLLGISSEIPTMNLGVTLLGVLYIGMLGSFGASLLNLGTEDDGIGLLLAAIIVTVAYDIGAFFAGRSVGRTPLTSVSPNKTVEGLVGGMIASVVAAMVLFGIVKIVEPFDSQGDFLDAVLFGLAGAVFAPLGDLAQSLIKRDLGIKDMGAILHGHGGFLDRFDALLFVLPAIYYLAQATFY